MVRLFYSSRIKDIYVEKRRQLITNFFDNILPVNIATASAVRSSSLKEKPMNTITVSVYLHQPFDYSCGVLFVNEFILESDKNLRKEICCMITRVFHYHVFYYSKWLVLKWLCCRIFASIPAKCNHNYVQELMLSCQRKKTSFSCIFVLRRCLSV